MKHLTMVMAILFATISYSQEKSGYYINNNNETVEGYLQAKDFLKPETVQFSVSQSGPYSPIDIAKIKEYGIKNELKLQKHTVDVDVTATVETSNKQPLWDKLTIFLNVLTEGDATLYSYEGAFGVRYFYSIKSKNVPIKQLVYKKYRKTPILFSENILFRQQLFSDLSCEGQKNSDFSRVNYTKDDLLERIRNYNQCNGGLALEYTNETVKKIKYVMTAYAGANITNFSVNTSNRPTFIEGNDSFISPSIGIEGAMILLKSNAEFFGRIEYERINGYVENQYYTGNTITTESTEIKGNLINIGFGARKNIQLSAKHKLFGELAVGFTQPYGHIYRVQYRGDNAFSANSHEYTIKNAFSGNVGIGYAFNNTYGIVFRYDTSRNMINNIGSGDHTKITKFTVNLRYTFN